jgi:HD-GYP domain-containing protein (c-di-GMP phosphodiesterase class II)
MKTKSLFVAAIFIWAALFIGTAFAQDNNENEAILQRTQEFYNNGNYLKAIESINQAIDLKENQKAFPEKVRLMAEASYFEYIDAMQKEAAANGGRVNAKNFDKYIVQLELHPQAASQRIFTIVESIFESELEALQAERQKYMDNKNNKWNKINERVDFLEDKQNELFDVVSGRVTVAQIKLAIAEVEMKKLDKALKIAVLCVGVLLIIVVCILIVIVYKNYKRRKQAQAHFETSMEVISSMGKDFQENPDLAAAAKEDAKKHAITSAILLGDAELSKQIMDFFSTVENRKLMADLQSKCFALGDKIDKYTFRQRTSRKVSELVLKVCNEAKLNKDVALVCYCASMVYDAGFLAVPKSILTGKDLTMKERQKIREHVQNAAEYFDFVPDQIKTIFLQAAEFHHENMDGKGYLAGLSGAKIPFIARVIRVCESYISLTSKRAYREIMDSDAAVKEMKSKAGIYDPKIIDLLEKVI